jgi:hypothetical protein
MWTLFTNKFVNIKLLFNSESFCVEITLEIPHHKWKDFNWFINRWVSLVSFAAITLCVASQRVFIVVSVYFVMTQSGNFEYTLVKRKVVPLL